MKRRNRTTAGAPSEQPDERRARSFAGAEDIIEAAQRIFATGFANPDRINCPPQSVIQTVAQSGQAPDDDMRGHLFECSECFSEFRAAVLRHREIAAVRTGASRWRTLTAGLNRRRAPLVFGAVALLLAVLGLFAWRDQRSASPQLSYSSPQPLPPPSPEATPKPDADQPERATGSVAERPRPKTRPPESGDWTAIRLDLNKYADDDNRQRSATPPAEKKKIELPAARVQLTLTLRKGSLAGVYRISVVDAFSRAITPPQIRKSNGRVLRVRLDLRGMEQRAHRLQIEREDNLDEYFIKVVKPQPEMEQ